MATAMALMVSVEETLMPAEVYLVEVVVGVAPLGEIGGHDTYSPHLLVTRGNRKNNTYTRQS